jgi:hypothetical protein
VSGWQTPSMNPGVALPPGIVVTPMGRRIGAWLIDRVLVNGRGKVPAGGHEEVLTLD